MATTGALTLIAAIVAVVALIAATIVYGDRTNKWRIALPLTAAIWLIGSTAVAVLGYTLDSASQAERPAVVQITIDDQTISFEEQQ